MKYLSFLMLMFGFHLLPITIVKKWKKKKVILKCLAFWGILSVRTHWLSLKIPYLRINLCIERDGDDSGTLRWHIPDVCQAELKYHLFYAASLRPAGQGTWVLGRILLVAPVEVHAEYPSLLTADWALLGQQQISFIFWSYGCLICSVY